MSAWNALQWVAVVGLAWFVGAFLLAGSISLIRKAMGKGDL